VAEAVENALHVGYRCAQRSTPSIVAPVLGRLCGASSAYGLCGGLRRHIDTAMMCVASLIAARLLHLLSNCEFILETERLQAGMTTTRRSAAPSTRC